ncbi:Filopodin [Trichuris trichiura]|uniref:Filopodin n=1 Tax=Trichuris trichiura TaxID=36087 RepID=A0A077ZKS9_TRITR|nr:Filopodin [Trichuris trichiura]
MDLCKKLEKAETVSDKIAALMAIAKLVPKSQADEILPQVAAAVDPKLMNLFLEEDPVETGAAGVVILSRLLAKASPEEEAKFVECFPSLVGFMEKLCDSDSAVEQDTYLYSLFCVRNLFPKITYDEELFTRVGDLFVKLYQHCREKVVEVAVVLLFSSPYGYLIFSKIVSLVKEEPENHSHLMETFSSVGQKNPPFDKVNETRWLKDMWAIISSLMRGRVKDELRWDAIISTEFLVNMFSRDVLMKETDFYVVAFTTASIELEYLINLVFSRNDLQELLLPLFCSALLLTQAPEMLSLLLDDDADFNEQSISALIKQLISTTSFMLVTIIENGEEHTLPSYLYVLLVETMTYYLRDAFDLLDKGLLMAAIPKMFLYYETEFQKGRTVSDFSSLSRFMHPVIVHGITFLPEHNLLEYVHMGMAIYEKYDIWSDLEAQALFNTYCYLLLKLPWDTLASSSRAAVQVVFNYFYKLYKNAAHPATPYHVSAGLIAIILTLSDKCSLEIDIALWRHIFGDIAVVEQFIARNFGRDNDDGTDYIAETMEFLTKAGFRLSSIISNNAHLKSTLCTEWLRVYSENDSSIGSSPVAVLKDLLMVFLGLSG